MLRALLPSSLLLVAASAQTVPVFGGLDALDLAVQAAPDGAILVCAPGTYSGFTMSNKSLTILAPAGATVVGRITCNIQSQQTIRLVGIDMAGGTSYDDQHWVTCTGNVFLEDCLVGGVTRYNPNGDRGWVYVTDSTIDSSTLQVGLALQDTDCVVVDSIIYGGNSDPTGPTNYPVGAVELNTSTLRAERCLLQGTGSWMGPGEGITLNDSASVAWLAECDVRSQTPSGVAAYGYAFSTIYHDALTTFSGTTYNTVQVPLAQARWAARDWSAGGTSLVEFHDQPGELAVAVLSWSPTPAINPLIAEPVYFGSQLDFVIGPWAASDATGVATIAITLPPSPLLTNEELYVTGVFVTTTPWRSTAMLGGLVQ